MGLDRERLGALLHPDVELVAPSGETLRGLESVVTAWVSPPCFDHLTLSSDLEAVERLGPGRAIATIGHVYRWSATRKVAYATQTAGVYELRGGLIRRVRLFSSVEAARAATNALARPG